MLATQCHLQQMEKGNLKNVFETTKPDDQRYLSSFKVGGFQVQRDRAASVSVGDQMIVMGGRANNGTELLGFEVYNEGTKSWKEVPEWRMAEGRYRYT